MNLWHSYYYYSVFVDVTNPPLFCWFGTIRYNAIRYDSFSDHTIQYKTIQSVRSDSLPSPIWYVTLSGYPLTFPIQSDSVSFEFPFNVTMQADSTEAIRPVSCPFWCNIQYEAIRFLFRPVMLCFDVFPFRLGVRSVPRLMRWYSTMWQIQQSKHGT